MKPSPHHGRRIENQIDRPRPVAELSLPQLAARSARRWRRFRQGARLTIVIFLLSLGSLAVHRFPPLRMDPVEVRPRAVATTDSAPTGAPASRVEVLDDQALFAALRDRSYVITTDQTGTKRIIFLDRSDPL